ncbi:MAG: hypothetical protein ACI8RD_013876, partial [Bacillariaceae sp.]
TTGCNHILLSFCFLILKYRVDQLVVAFSKEGTKKKVWNLLHHHDVWFYHITRSLL